jgi:hypothetical protein
MVSTAYIRWLSLNVKRVADTPVKLGEAETDRHLVNLAGRCCHARSRWGPAAAVAAVLALLGALPAAPASAGTKPTAISLPPGGVSELPPGAMTELLGEAGLGTGGIAPAALEAPLLARQLSDLPGIGDLATVDGLGGGEGIGRSLLAALGVMAEGGEPLEELVGGFGLALDLEERLEAVYQASAAREAPSAPESLEEAVGEALGRSPEEVIDEGLESRTLGELLSSLLSEAAHPGAVAGAIFSATDREELHELLGTTLGHEPFAEASVAEAASAIGVTPAELTERVGKTPTELPETALALVIPLRNGQALGVFAAGKGLAFALIGAAPPAEEEAEEEASESEGGSEVPAGSGASSATGSSQSPIASTAASTTSATMPAPAAAPPAAAGASAGRVRIVSHRTKGSTVTLVVRVPAGGRLTLTGRGLRPVRRAVARASRVSIRLSATRAAVASLRRHRRLTLDVLASFDPASGQRLSATATVKLG